MEDELVLGMVIERAKERDALDVVPVEVRNEDVREQRLVLEFALELVPEDPEPGAAIEDVEVVAEAHFDAGGVASVAQVLGLGRGRRPAHSQNLTRMLPRSPDFGLKIESSDAATAPSIVSLVPRGDRGVRPNRRKYGAAISQAPALPYNSGFLARGLPVRKRRVGRPPEGRRGASATKFRMLQPDYKEFARLAREATLVPVVKSVTADLLTPVSAYLSIARHEPHCFLLESIERGEQIGRYTFLGARPYMRLWSQGDQVTIERGKRQERHKGDIFSTLKHLLRAHRPAQVPGLPPFTAGAVGYFAYDAVRRLEKIGEHAKNDLAVPDCVLMFFDRLLAFDHLRHQIHIIATADLKVESPKRAYQRAVKDIASLEK